MVVAIRSGALKGPNKTPRHSFSKELQSRFDASFAFKDVSPFIVACPSCTNSVLKGTLLISFSVNQTSKDFNMINFANRSAFQFKHRRFRKVQMLFSHEFHFFWCQSKLEPTKGFHNIIKHVLGVFLALRQQVAVVNKGGAR